MPACTARTDQDRECQSRRRRTRAQRLLSGAGMAKAFTGAHYPADNRHPTAWPASSSAVANPRIGGPMQDAQMLVTQYLETFNETDADRRRELLAALYATDCTYTDPHVDLQGPDQIDGF